MQAKQERQEVPRVAKVDYDIEHVQKTAVWDGIIQADSKWAFAKENSYKRTLIDVLEKEDYYRKEASALQKYILDKFTDENMYAAFVDSMSPEQVEDTTVDESVFIL